MPHRAPVHRASQSVRLHRLLQVNARVPLLRPCGSERPAMDGALPSVATGLLATAVGLAGTAWCCASFARGRDAESEPVPSRHRSDPMTHPHKDCGESTAAYREPVGTYSTCLDRPYVQDEIRWARKYGKKIITVFEDGSGRPGHFDHAKARERYKGTEWEGILDIAAIKYQRGKHEAQAMLNQLFGRATGGAANGRGSIYNHPYRWDFFLSHHQQFAGEQANNLYFLLERQKKTAWYDRYMNDPSEGAMEEGVRYSTYFLLFLTSNPTDAVDGVNSNESAPEVSVTPDSHGGGVVQPAGDLSELCRTKSESAAQRAKARLRAYTDRPVLRQRIVDWALRNDADDNRCLVLGEPGSGKTTLLSQLTQADDVFQSVVLAHHFCEAAREPTLKPSAFVQNLTKQLYLKAPEYKALVDGDRDLSDIVRRVLTGSQDDKVEQDKEGQPLRDLTAGVLEPLAKAYPGTRRPQVGHVLVVDSLDEAVLPYQGTTHTVGRSIVFLLKECFTARLFPGWMKVLATSRRDVPEVAPAQLCNWHRIDLMDHRNETEGVFRKHINRRLEAPGSELLARAGGPAVGPSSAGFSCKTAAGEYFARLVTQAEGIFQYLETALKDIERGATTLVEVPNLPRGLGELYGHFFDRKFGDARSSSYKLVRPVFDAVAASDGGVSETLLQNVLWLADPKAELRDVTERLKSVGEFLRHIDGPQPAAAIDRSSSAPPACQRGHEMEKVIAQTRRYCDMCRRPFDGGAESFRCDVCDYDMCLDCARGPPPQDPSLSSELTAERRTFYHHSLREWLTEEQEYRVYTEDGDRALGVVHFAALARGASSETLESFATLCVERLGFPNSLTGAHLAMLRNRAENNRIRGDVYALMSHLGKALYLRGADMHEAGKLMIDAAIPVDEPWRWDGEWAHKRCVCRAAGDGNLAALKLFMAAQADLQCTGGPLSPLHWAVMKGQKASISVLASGNGEGIIPVNPGGITPLHMAAQGRVECMRELFSCRVAGDINAVDTMGMTPLHIASKGSFVYEVAELCDQAANLEAKESILGWTALHLAADNGLTDTARVLIQKGADVNARSKIQRTPLHLACCSTSGRQSAHVSVSTFCSAPNLDVDLQDAKGFTALHWACALGHAQAVRELLAANADTSLLSNDGATALHWACKCSKENHLDIVKVLLEVPGAVAHAQSEEGVPTLLSCVDLAGRTALHWASKAGDPRVVSHLLHARATVDARDQAGMTPLHVAAKGGEGQVFADAERTIMCLVKDFGADVLAKTRAGETPLQLAKDRREMLGKNAQAAPSEQDDQACEEMIETLRMLCLRAQPARGRDSR